MERVELHCHTSMTAMNGVSPAGDLVDRAVSLGQQAIAITDLGGVYAFPAAERNCPENFKVIYGCEVDMLRRISRKPVTNRIILIAQNCQGLENLYRIISEAHTTYMHERDPLVPRKWSLSKHRVGLLVGAPYDGGELTEAISEGREEAELEKIAAFYDWLEVVPPDIGRSMLPEEGTIGESDARKVTEHIISLGDRLGIPVVASGDAYYSTPTDKLLRSILLDAEGIDNPDEQPDLHLRSTEEMKQAFSWLGEKKAEKIIVTNTNRIADQCERISLLPEGKHYPVFPDADRIIEADSRRSAEALFGPDLPPNVTEQLDLELSVITSHGYASQYFLARELVKESRSRGYLVESRGCAAASLVAFLLGITEINPLDERYDISYETFSGLDGEKEPDFDLNFAPKEQFRIQKMLQDRLGKDRVFRAGKVVTLSDNAAYRRAKRYFEKYGIEASEEELREMTERLSSVRRTTGQNPVALILLAEGDDIENYTPVQYPADIPDQWIRSTQLDYHFVERALFKVDIIGHNDPEILFQLKKRTGVDPEKVDSYDEAVIQMICDGDTENIPEFGNDFCRDVMRQTHPTSVQDLIRVSGLIHGTDVWGGNGEKLIKNGTARLSDLICLRDDILQYLQTKGIERADAYRIMETVRKGRAASGWARNWPSDCKLMREHGVPDWYIASCEKIRYLFPRAHAASYVLIALRLTWYKLHFPDVFEEVVHLVKGR